jgi:hypothetical protein
MGTAVGMLLNGDRGIRIWKDRAMKQAIVAVMAAAMCGSVSGAAFVGSWVNIDTKTDGIVRVDITESNHFYGVHTWVVCTPEPCDWGIKGAAAGKFLTVVYTFGMTTVTMTITQISDNSLRVHTVSETPVKTTTRDDYFQPKGSGRALPDLSITEMTVNRTVSVSGETTPVVTATIRNNGPGILTGGTIVARLDSCTRNGQPVDLLMADYFYYTGSLLPGQEVTQSLAAGPDLGMPVGHYVVRLRVDPDNTIAEFNEDNNLSAELWFDVVLREFLAGTVTFNHQPISDYAHAWPEQLYLMDNAMQFVEGYDFWYEPQSGHFMFSGLPVTGIGFWMRFRTTEGEVSLPGNFWVAQGVELSWLTDAEAGNFELQAKQIMHMTEPFDNRQVLETIRDIQHHCLPFSIQWDPVPGATEYRVLILRARDFDNPGGYGQIETVIDETLAGLQYSPFLPSAPTLEHYELFIKAYNASQEEIGTVQITRKDGATWQYLFKMCGRCSIADLNRDCQVTMPDLAIFAEHWMEDWR